jgi:hypothetical protein
MSINISTFVETGLQPSKPHDPAGHEILLGTIFRIGDNFCQPASITPRLENGPRCCAIAEFIFDAKHPDGGTVAPLPISDSPLGCGHTITVLQFPLMQQVKALLANINHYNMTILRSRITSNQLTRN